MRFPLLFIYLLLTGYTTVAQQLAFDFMEQPADAHVSALGGYAVSSTVYIPGLYLENPALLEDSLSNNFSAGFIYLPSGASFGQASGVVDLGKAGVFHISARRMGYGAIPGYDETGMYTGDVSANETSLIIGRSYRSGNFSLGANLEFASSNIAGFGASALALDLGGTFTHPEKELVVGMAIRNLGFVSGDYTGSASSRVPLDIQVGATFKPEYMPFRFTLTAFNLIGRETTVTTDLEAGFAKKLTSYLNVGLELVWNPHFQVIGGYNFLRRYEMSLNQGTYGAGWSGGLRFMKKGFIFQYARSGQHAAGTLNHLSIGLNTDMVFGLKRNKNE